MWTEKMSWGEIPTGFTKINDDRGNRLVVLQERSSHIDFSICRTGDGDLQQGYHGRAPMRTRKLPDGATVLPGSYQHGGFLRAITGEWFSSWPPRPFRELTITEELRRIGRRTVEVYAECVRRSLGSFDRRW